METSSSISYVMPNLILGLCKNARGLRPYSKVFHNDLGYQIHSLELTFLLSIGRRTTPDAMVVSTKLQNTLLFEWTRSENPSLKNDQLQRYSHIKNSDLINTAAVPVAAANSHDIVIILTPLAIESFYNHLSHSGQIFPILQIEIDGDHFNLHKARGSFCVSQTDSFFTGGLQGDRLPRYLPFSLEKPDFKNMVPSIIQELVALFVRGVKTVTITEFCRGYIPAWEFIGDEKQRELARETGRIISSLCKKTAGRQIIKRIESTPLTWELNCEAFQHKTRSYRTMLVEFIAEVRGDNYQLEMELDVPG